MSGQPHSDAKRIPQSTNLNMKHRRYDYKSEPEIGSQLQEHKQKKKSLKFPSAELSQQFSSPQNKTSLQGVSEQFTLMLNSFS